MDIQLYAIHVVPVILIVYFACVLFMRVPKEVLLASLAGGLVMAILNALGDLLAYYASWWHYAASGLVLGLPLPFYLTPLFIFGGLAYVLIWRFSRGHEQDVKSESSQGIDQSGDKGWRPQHRGSSTIPVLVLLIGVPLLGFARDLLNAEITHSSFLVWDSALAGPIDFLLWVVMYYAGYSVFRRMLSPKQLLYPLTPRR